MSKKTFTKDKKGKEEEWSWEETPEVVEALKKLHRPLDIRKVAEEDILENYTLGDK
jgi:hypothetical protein